MIYLLEFTGNIYEFKRSRGKQSMLLHRLAYNFEDIMIIHRYDLFFYFKDKFQTNNPDKINFSKLDGKNIILYHLDVYSECPEKIDNLINHCIKNDINLFIPVSDGLIKHYFLKDDKSENPHRYTIRDIVEGYEHVLYDFTMSIDEDLFKLKTTEFFRDLKLRILFD